MPEVFDGIRASQSEAEILAGIAAGDYDFIDFGSSAGGSIDYCMRRFNALRGVGIDLLVPEVQITRDRGFDCI